MITVKINGNIITIQDDRNAPFIEEVIITKSELKLINKKVRLKSRRTSNPNRGNLFI